MLLNWEQGAISESINAAFAGLEIILMNTPSTFATFLPEAHPLFSKHRLDTQLVCNFFMLFARFEYALKAAGFLNEAGRFEEPKLDWRSFANKVEAQLFHPPSSKVSEALSYLQSRPPMRQVYENGTLLWRKRSRRTNQSEAEFLLESVRTVRNNLFHGGKEMRGPLAERDRRLVQSSLLVLAHAISLSDSVSHAFSEAGSDVEAA